MQVTLYTNDVLGKIFSVLAYNTVTWLCRFHCTGWMDGWMDILQNHHFLNPVVKEGKHFKHRKKTSTTINWGLHIKHACEIGEFCNIHLCLHKCAE